MDIALLSAGTLEQYTSNRVWQCLLQQMELDRQVVVAGRYQQHRRTNNHIVECSGQWHEDGMRMSREPRKAANNRPTIV